MNGVQFGELPYLQEHAAVNTIAFSPDGKVFAVALRDGSLITHNTTTWTRVRQHNEPSLVLSIAFSPNNRCLAFGSEDMTCRLWDTVNGETLLVMKGHTGGVDSVAFSPCGKQIASASVDRTIRLWSSETGDGLLVLTGHEDIILSVAYSADGRRLVSGSRDQTIRVWDSETGEPEPSWAIPHVGASRVALSADGRQFALMTGLRRGEVHLVDAITGETGLILDDGTDGLTDIAFSPFDKFIVSSSRDRVVRLWDSSSGQLISRLSGHNSRITTCTFSPDGLQIASGDVDGIIRLWEVNTNRSSSTTQKRAAGVRTVAYSHEGLFIISDHDDSTIQRWDSSTGTSGSIPLPSAPDVYSVALSPNGHWFASGCEDGNIRLLNVRTDVVERILLGSSYCQVVDMSFSRCGRWLVSYANGGVTRLWDLESADDQGKVMGEREVCISDRLRTMDYSPDGHRLVLGTDASPVMIWDFQSYKIDVKLEGHTGAVICVAYSPCGNWILSGSNDKTFRLWSGEVDNWYCAAVVSRCLEAVTSVAWSPVVPMEFVTGSADGSVRVWRVLGAGARDVSVRMQWGSHIGRLCAADLSFKGAVGLGPIYRKLLAQRGATGDSLLPEGDELGEVEDE
ncbi:WD40 repeat-like protein [Linnemannia elongata AG-77]|uniref:WD40 repeat-like protein n=1 Tax=Linnemannia elongata AG-77 TaxID=1314771 RepID=A0A197K4G7_9FUNG|nr:WD40 repeat-like protein [Linnemannia elongata AG-77]